jgi:hypothetical protein
MKLLYLCVYTCGINSFLKVYIFSFHANNFKISSNNDVHLLVSEFLIPHLAYGVYYSWLHTL